MLDQRLGRWPNIKPALDQCVTTWHILYAFNTYNAEIFVDKPWRQKGFQFEIIIAVSASSSRSI